MTINHEKLPSMLRDKYPNLIYIIQSVDLSVIMQRLHDTLRILIFWIISKIMM